MLMVNKKVKIKMEQSAPLHAYKTYWSKSIYVYDVYMNFYLMKQS